MRGRALREPRLDPVRWRRPGRATLLRSAVVAVLIVTAAVVMWARPGACEPGRAGCDNCARTAQPGTAAAECRPAGVAGSAAGVAGSATPREQDDPPPAAAAAPGRSGGSPDAIAVPPGSIGVPIRLAEPTALRLIHPGDHVDVFRLSGTGESPQAIATAALVLEVTGAEDPTSGGLLLALTPADARRAVTTPGGGYAVLIRPDG
jgi:hypothetical protein